ncbi:small conductance calcium-activated potassium channel protein 1-like [Babylonia areolata]|uniref:small conductance calcium-activated potassium channel protein 1-like n=1 Tax=Babylonia areolata TaxID=304850 RepID=UPI003FD60834
MEEPALPLGVSCFNKYSSTDTLLTSVTSDAGSPSRQEMKEQEEARQCSLSQRLRRRRDVLQRRKCIVDISFVLGMTGIVLVILDTELRFSKTIEATSAVSLLLKVLTSVSTACLLFAIVAYHVTGLRLHMASAGFQDWRLAMTITKWFKLVLELLVCSLHPLPFPTFNLPTTIVRFAGLHSILQDAELPLNGVLTILMFMRLYLLGRLIVVHSKLFLDTSVQSLGALSRVKINAQFVFRALMSTSPMLVLGSWMLGTFFINSWNSRVCEVYTDPDSHSTQFGQSMWLTAVTFLTVGYGDLVPRSYCARVIACFTGLMGVGSMALSVAVLAKNIEQSRAEKYVHTFVQQVEVDKKRRRAASDVLKQALRINRDRRRGKGPSSSVMMGHRSRMLQAVRAMHRAQFLQTALSEFTVGTVEVHTGVSSMQGTVAAIQAEQRALSQRMANLETLAMSMSQGLADIKTLLKDKRV